MTECSQYFTCSTCVLAETIGTVSNGVKYPCSWCISSRNCVVIDRDAPGATCLKEDYLSTISDCPEYWYPGYIPLIILGSLLITLGILTWYKSAKAPDWRSKIVEDSSDAAGNNYITISTPTTNNSDQRNFIRRTSRNSNSINEA